MWKTKMEIIINKGILSLKTENILVFIGTCEGENFRDLYLAMTGMRNKHKKQFTDVKIEGDGRLI